jgi:predicted metal-binding membrane protein
MRGMDAGPGTSLGPFWWFLGIWVAMMAAMMLPSLVPTMAVYAEMIRRRDAVRPLLFGLGYLLVWALAGAFAYAVFTVGRRFFGGALVWHVGGRWFAGAILALAAVYEVTRVKDHCLGTCRSPRSFLAATWRRGSGGALVMGAKQGAWCVGCCWALMAALFALGGMNLTWMALVALLICVEKTVPSRTAARWGAAAILIVLAIAVCGAPHIVPGLVVPGSAQHPVAAMGSTH